MLLADDNDQIAAQDDLQVIESLKVQALEGGKAKSFLASSEWTWFNERVLKPLEDEAMETLKKSKTDEDRMKAQQMILAADKPRTILTYLVKQGEVANMQLLSTRQNGG